MSSLRALLVLALSAVTAALVSLAFILIGLERSWFAESGGGRQVIEVPVMIEPTPVLNPPVPIIIIDGDYRVLYNPINPEATLPMRIFTVTPAGGPAQAVADGESPIAFATATFPENYAIEGYATALPTDCIVHTVSPGETLTFIAQRRGVELDLLYDINDLTEADALSLQPGDKLIIPWANCVAALHDMREGSGGSSSAPVATETPAQLTIVAVRDAGNLELEAVVIRNRGATSVDLEGWTLADGAGNEFVFGSQRLFAGAEMRVSTRAGADQPTQLFWGLTGAIWQSGAQVRLSGPGGAPLFTYTVP